MIQTIFKISVFFRRKTRIHAAVLDMSTMSEIPTFSCTRESIPIYTKARRMKKDRHCR